MELKFFGEDKAIKSEDMNGLLVFRFDTAVLVYSKNEELLGIYDDINEFLIKKIRGPYYMYSSDGETINISDESYDEFFIFNSFIEDIHFSRLLFLKLGMYWKIFNMQTNKFISKKKLKIENSQINLLKNDPSIYELSMKDEYDKDITLDLISAKII